MKYKIISFLALLFILGCATQKEIQLPKEEEIIIPTKPSIDFKEIHKGLTGNFIFYISRAESQGDIWLYNFDANTKWQITSENNHEINLISCSPNYQYIIYNQQMILNLKENKNMDFCSVSYQKIKPDFIDQVQWVQTNQFYFLGSTNQSVTNIFFAQQKEDEWCIESVNFWPEEINNKTKYSLSLSPSKKYLVFITYDNINVISIYIYHIINKEFKKLAMIKNNSDLIWSEKDNALFYHEDSIIYSIAFSGEKKLVLLDNKKITKMFPNLKQLYKFFYITLWNNVSFINMKNTDLMGPGKTIFQIPSIKDSKISENLDLLFYDNIDNEIFYYDLSTYETKKVLDHASLFRLTLNE